MVYAQRSSVGPHGPTGIATTYFGVLDPTPYNGFPPNATPTPTTPVQEGWHYLDTNTSNLYYWNGQAHRERDGDFSRKIAHPRVSELYHFDLARMLHGSHVTRECGEGYQDTPAAAIFHRASVHRGRAAYLSASMTDRYLM